MDSLATIQAQPSPNAALSSRSGIR
jgi:hypothetical protein